MIAEKDIGPLESFHTYLLYLLLFADKHYFRKHSYKPHEEERLTNGVFSGFIPFLVFIINVHIFTFKSKI